MKILKIILLICNFILLINSLHFGLFAILPFLRKRKKNKIISHQKHKFMILIAARNEEKVIGNLIDSLNSQEYDKSLYKICVIPNNCNDNTKNIALDKKCIVIEPNVITKTKGEVLNYTFDYFKNDKSFDTYVIFDADNVVDKYFLKNINNKLNEGYKVVQGFRDTKNLYENYLSGSYALFFYLQNLFLYDSRNRIGESSTVNGTGYAISKEYLNNINHSAKTSTEDIELTCICALNHEIIGFSSDARFYDEQVNSFKVSVKQRKRWIQGSMQVFKTYIKNLFKEIKNNNSFQLIDMIHMLFLPINQALAFIFLLLSYIFIIPFNFIVLGIIIGYIGEIVVSLLLLIIYKKNIRKLISSILFFPLFHLSWIPIYIYAIFNSKNNWEEIKHTKSLKIDEILEE